MLNTSPSDLAGAAAGGQFHSTQPSVVRRRSFDDAEAARKVADATAGQTSEPTGTRHRILSLKPSGPLRPGRKLRARASTAPPFSFCSSSYSYSWSFSSSDASSPREDLLSNTTAKKGETVHADGDGAGGGGGGGGDVSHRPAKGKAPLEPGTANAVSALAPAGGSGKIADMHTGEVSPGELTSTGRPIATSDDRDDDEKTMAPAGPDAAETVGIGGLGEEQHALKTGGVGVGGGVATPVENSSSSLQPLAGRCCFGGCGKVTVFRCRRCREAFYCSRDHQRRHWGKHRGACKEGIGGPPPRLAHLALPLPRPQPRPPPRPQAKAVGWADSTPCASDKGMPPGGKLHAVPSDGGSGSATGRSTAPFFASGGSARIGEPGRGMAVGSGGKGGDSPFAPSVGFREGTSHTAFSAATAAAGVVRDIGPLGVIGSAKRSTGVQDSSFRSSRGGTSWTVPSGDGGGGDDIGGHSKVMSDDSGAGSAKVWPASSSLGGALVEDDGSGGGDIAEAAAAAARKRNQRVSASCGIPPPAARPSEDTGRLASASRASLANVDMLVEMGFEPVQATHALGLCHGSVERAAEWLLSAADFLDTGGGSGSGGVDATYGPHLQPTSFDVEGRNSSVAWRAGGELHAAIGREVSDGGLTVDVNDDLITNADAADVGQGLDLREFWSTDAKRSGATGAAASVGSRLGVIGDGGRCDDREWTMARGVSFGERQQEAREQESVEDEEDDDSQDLVTSYEECVGGAPADVVVYYRRPDSPPSPSAVATGEPAAGGGGGGSVDCKRAAAVAAAASVVAGRDEDPPLVIGSAAPPSDTDTSGMPLAVATAHPVPLSAVTCGGNGTAAAAVASEVGPGIVGIGAEDGLGTKGKGELTVIVRPLPSTAPASLASDSSRGEGADDRHEPSHDTEHVLQLSWEEAEALAWRYQATQPNRESGLCSASAGAAAGGAIGGSFLDPSTLPRPQAPAPSSPLSPPPYCWVGPISAAGSSSARAPSSSVTCPTWRRKNKVGRIIAAMLERCVDGGYQTSVPVGSVLQQAWDALIVRTRERRRGRPLPKWGSSRSVSLGARPTYLEQQPARPPSKWSSEPSELVHAWSCQACTFFNEDPVFRTACEMCRTERPRGPVISTQEVGWEDGAGVGAGPAGTGTGGGKSAGCVEGSFLPPVNSKISAAAASNAATFDGAGFGDLSVGQGTYIDGEMGDGVAVGGVSLSQSASHRHIDVEDENEFVDGILGGVSPTGVLSSPPPDDNINAQTSAVWEDEVAWEGFGSTTFGESPVNLQSRLSNFAFDYCSGGGGDSAPPGNSPGGQAGDDDGETTSQ